MAYESPTTSTFSLSLDDDHSVSNAPSSFKNTSSSPSMSNSTISDFLYLGNNNNDVPNLTSSVSSLSLNNNPQDNIPRPNLDYNSASLSAFNFPNVQRPVTYSPSQPPINLQPKPNTYSFGFNSPVEEQSIPSLSNPNPQQLNALPPQQRQLMPIAPKGIPTPPALTVAQQQQQQQIPSQQFNAILKLSENFEKFMSEVDQRLTALEKITREILVNQKTQKDFIQQQYNQILTKLTELSESKVTSPTQTSSSNTTTTTAINTNSTKSYREREREREKEQELADAQLAAQLQSQMDQESRASAAPPPPTEKEEKCPICDLRFPVSVIEKHCNDIHFNDGSSRPSNAALSQSQLQAQNQDQSWFGRLFGNKTETKPPENQIPPPTAIVRTTSSATLPYQQQYVLAPAYIQNPQGQPQYLYRTAPSPGQVAPTGYTPATQVYYDSQGNVYNPNATRS